MGSHTNPKSRPQSSPLNLVNSNHRVALRPTPSTGNGRQGSRAALTGTDPHHHQNIPVREAQNEDDGEETQLQKPYQQAMGGTEPTLKDLESCILTEAAATALLIVTLEDLPNVGSEGAKTFRTAVDSAPITKGSLSELDISSIINNAKLRHDINFDRELHFRPNLDGQRGQVKRQAQQDYWKAITAELSLYRELYTAPRIELMRQGLCYERHRNLIQKRIPSMFETIKEIVKNLVPERDQKAVDEGVDVSVIMQEIERNVCDFVNIVEGIAALLKKHCAPMRDEMVDNMVKKIAHGDPASISSGLCDLFGVLEAMKLDVANHQIRHLRYPLIEDTINFEQKYHRSRIDRKRINPNLARHWYLEHLYELEGEPYAIMAGKAELRAFVTAFVRHLLPTCPIGFPDTFNLDSRRIRGLRAEIQDMHFQNICLEVFERLAKEVRGMNGVPRSATNDLRRAFKAVAAPPNVPGGMSAPANFGNIITEMVRHVLLLCGIQSGYNAALAQRVEQRLFEALSSREVIIHHAQRLEYELISAVLGTIEREKYINASPCDIFNALVPPPTPSPPSLAAIAPRPPPLLRPDGQSDVAQRVTHVAVLHWRIWAELVYLNEDIDPNQSPEDIPTRATSPAPATLNDLPQTQPEIESNLLDSQQLPPGAGQQPVHAAVPYPPP